MCPQEITTGPYPEPETPFVSKIAFYDGRFMVHHQISKLEENPLLAVHNSLFSIFAAALHYLFHLQPKDMR
jgi:hypothetical protein